MSSKETTTLTAEAKRDAIACLILEYEASVYPESLSREEFMQVWDANIVNLFDKHIQPLLEQYASTIPHIRWVKASERPKKRFNYHVKVGHNYEGRQAIWNSASLWNGEYWEHPTAYENYSGKPTKLNVVEWLDESQSTPQQEGQLRKALEKAVEVIKQWHQADDVWDIYYNHAPEMKVIREALQGVKDVSDGWVSVETALPEKEKRVLVYTGMKPHDDFMIGYISEVTGYWFDEEAHYLQIPVLAWRELPAPPKQ